MVEALVYSRQKIRICHYASYKEGAIQPTRLLRLLLKPLARLPVIFASVERWCK